MREFGKRMFIAIAAFFASACCASLPRLPAKRVAFPSLIPEVRHVTETSEIWRDEKRNRDVPVKIYGDRGPVVVVNHDTFVEADPRNAEIAAIAIAVLRAWMLGDEDARAWFDDPGSGAAGNVRVALERKPQLPSF